MTAATHAVHHGHPGIVEPTADPHLTGAFQPVVDELTLTDLPVTGELPAGMDGTYLRNGPNPRFSPLGRYMYPLDGDGMIHAMTIRDGRASYANRFVRTPALQVEEKAGKALWPGLLGGPPPGADVVGPELAGTMRDMPDINIVRHGGKLLALAEAATPFCLAPDLATIGRETYDGALATGMTAHPKIDPVTGEMVLFTYMLEAPYLTWSTVAADGTVTRANTPVSGVDRPVMIHDMAMTATAVVLFLGPLFFDMAAAMRGGSLLSWEPDEGTRIAVIPRDGSPVRWASTDAFWVWHAANAFDGDGSSSGAEVDPSGRVTVDLVRHDTPGFFGPGGQPALVRVVVDPTTGNVTQTVVDERAVEFPRVDDRLLGHRHDVIAVGSRTDDDGHVSGSFGAVRWYSLEHGSSQQWHAGGLLVGEPAYVPEPGRTGADTGWWVTFATEPDGSRSCFLVFPAAEPGSGPIARVDLPVRVPLGLHGNWLPTEE